MKSCEGTPGKSCEGTQKQGHVRKGSLAAMQKSGLLRSSWNASRRRTGDLGVIFRTFSKGLPRKVRAPSGLLRSSSRSAERSKFRQNRLLWASVPQKERDSKMCQKSGQITPPIPQNERFFRVATSKKVRFRRKNDFSTNLSKLRRKPPKWATWWHRANPGKLGKNDPTEPHTATRDQSTADSILSSNTFFGGGVCFFLSCPLLFLLFVLFLLLMLSSCLLFFSLSFLLVLLLSSSKDKEEKKNKWKKKTKEKQKQKKRDKTKKYKTKYKKNTTRKKRRRNETNL